MDRTENESFSHITRLAASILKATCAAVILGSEEKILLANSEGLHSEDDFWLPEFCAWALAQESGLSIIEDLTKDERSETLLMC